MQDTAPIRFLLRLREAAAYLEMPEAKFKRLVGYGRLPPPRRVTATIHAWLRRELDECSRWNFIDRPIKRRTDSMRQAAAMRAAALAQRTPQWADKAAIRTVYEQARRQSLETGVPHHVDHEIPLRGKLVSGLHVHQNLRVILAADNQAKNNAFDPC